MKSRIKIILVSAAIVISVVSYSEIHQSKKLNALLLENVEALADPENSNTVECAGYGTVDCPIFHIKVKIAYESYNLRH